MKKILMGLVAVSALSFSATVNPSLDPAKETAVFETGMEGKIAIKGKITSVVNPVKYTIFASTGDGNTVGEDILDIQNFIVSTDAEVGGLETSSLPKVYVKRVDTDGSLLPLLPSDNVTFAMYIPYQEKKSDWKGASNSFQFTPFQFLTPAQLEQVFALGTNLKINNYGYLIDNSGAYYPNSHNIIFGVKDNGVMSISLRKIDWSSDTLLSDNVINAVTNYFNPGVELQAQQVAIYVQVK